MKKYLVIGIIIALSLISLGAISCGDQNNSRTQNNYVPPVIILPPVGPDADGDTIPDLTDCQPANALLWQWIYLYPDADHDNIPDSGLAVRFCVGDPATTYPPNYTATPPPPLDHCLNDPTNTCTTLRPYLRFEFDFDTAKTFWTMSGTCFPDPAQPDNWPEMGNGIGTGGTVVGDINPEAVAAGYCLFAFNFTPSISNSCGPENFWLPCQSTQQILYSGLNGDGLGNLQVFISTTGYVTDEIELPWAVVDNLQNGANYRIGLSSTPGGGSNTNIFANLPIDTDGDGFLNPADNCIWVANPGQEADPGNLIGANGLRVGNACTTIDRDNDGAYNWLDPAPDNPNIWE